MTKVRVCPPLTLIFEKKKKKKKEKKNNKKKMERYLLVSASYVIEDRIPSTTGSRLVEYVEILERLELIFLMHVVFRHDLLELGACHIHTTPPTRQELRQLSLKKPTTTAADEKFWFFYHCF